MGNFGCTNIQTRILQTHMTTHGHLLVSYAAALNNE